MQTLALVGAGPQSGLAIAREFGAHDHQITLISRDQLRVVIGE